MTQRAAPREIRLLAVGVVVTFVGGFLHGAGIVPVLAIVCLVVGLVMIVVAAFPGLRGVVRR